LSTYKTFSSNNKNWFLINADSKVLGRVSSVVSSIIRGKHKPIFTPNINCGDNVIIVNAEKIILTGKKYKYKVYTHHTGYPSGQRNVNIERIRKKFPERILKKSIKGMIPKNRLSDKIFKNLFVYSGENHPHLSQKPKEINL
jgi:large subunit ribosomal protein L13|tara:strand:- start:97 stop:522 length:426 start_codon:yes stop_codon:yes gene_type:complete